MRQLKKVIVCVSLLGILQLCKHFFSPNSTAYFFSYNLVSCYQLFLFFYCCFAVTVESAFLKRWKRGITPFTLALFLALAVAIEGLCTYWMNHPQRIPSAAFPYFKHNYDNFDSRVFQYERNNVAYNDSLLYQMKSEHHFIFSNREFSDSFRTNKAGFRDDDSSLIQPEILCVGDSYTLGWGNSQLGNLPALVEERTGLKTLNAAMSSYGTARELIQLGRVDFSKVKYIFWQYCDNDADENKAYLDNKYTLPILPEKQFDSTVEMYQWGRKYFPFRHSLTLCKLYLRKLLFGRAIPRSTSVPASEITQAKSFLEIIRKSPIDFSRVKLIVFALRPYPLEKNFVKQLDQVANTSPYREAFKGNVVTIDASTIVKKDDYYILDVHIKLEGNRKIADALIKAAGLK
jgi:hypothetical protein